MNLEDAVTIDEIYRRIRAVSPSDHKEVVPRPAAAGILWRRRTASIEVYLAKRSSSLAFAGGQWSFPGGVLEACDGLVAGTEPGTDTYIRALRRELAEELGVDFSSRPDSEFVDHGRFVTPPVSPLRFDARYFALEIVKDVPLDPRASNGELDDGRWIAPATALAAWASGDLALPSPVRVALNSLAAAGGHGSAIDGARVARLAEAENALGLWELVPGVRVRPLRSLTLPPATHTNCYVLGTSRLAIVDPGAGDEGELERLVAALAGDRNSDRAVAEIWLTHHHGDHVAGASWLSNRLGVPVRAHRATAERLTGRIDVRGDLDEGSWFDGGDGAGVQTIFTPGHAPGHICFVDERTRAAVCGDMVAGVGTILIDAAEGDMAAYLASLERLDRLELKVLAPAHGGSIPEPGLRLRDYVKHRLWREARVVEAVAANGGATLMELVAVAYADVAPAIFPVAARSLGAHLNKLVDEGRVVRLGDGFSLATAGGTVGK